MKTMDMLFSSLENHWPGKYFLSRFVAGEEMDDALMVAEKLNKEGFTAIIHFLGEEEEVEGVGGTNSSKSRYRYTVIIYREILREIFRRKLEGRISIKPSQLGLKISRDFYWYNLLKIARDAFLFGIPLEIDMETEDTVVETINETVSLAEYYQGLDLRQTLAMNCKKSFNYLFALMQVGVKVRICKGAYQGDISDKNEIKGRFRSLASYLLRRRADPEFATDDLELINHILSLISDYHPVSCGFQFFFGLRKKTWEKLKDGGERVSIYVPFGAKNNWCQIKRCRRYFL